MATQSSSASIDQLIICSPYEKPGEHWKYNRETRRFSREPGRRSAGYIRASDASKSFDDPGEFVELPLVNKIRPRVEAWRDDGLSRRERHYQTSASSTGATRNSGRVSGSFFANWKRLRR